MNRTITTRWQIVCRNCYHSADNHGPTSCEQVIHREYTGELFYGTKENVDARIVCSCGLFEPERIKSAKEEVWE